MLLCIMPFISFGAGRACFAQGDSAPQAEMRKDCTKLKVDESKCECIISSAESVGDGLLMGRFVFGLYLVNNGLEPESDLDVIKHEIESSQFYLRGESAIDDTTRATLVKVAVYYRDEVRSKCGRIVIPMKK